MKTGNGYQKQTVYIRPDQYVYLSMLALNNKIDETTPRPDLSYVLRDIIDKYKAAADAAEPTKGRSKRG